MFMRILPEFTSLKSIRLRVKCDNTGCPSLGPAGPCGALGSPLLFLTVISRRPPSGVRALFADMDQSPEGRRSPLDENPCAEGC